ncbi:MAG: NUDIX domain-containing protein [Patescibacteria group bacterium]
MSKYQLFRVVVAAIIYNEKGEFLLAQRSKKDEHQPGVWAVPAGHIEENASSLDSLEENLKREVKEEIGVEINIEKYLDSHSWVEIDYKKITIVFLCTIKSGVPKPLDETQELRWLKADKIIGLNLAPHIQRLIERADLLIGK